MLWPVRNAPTVTDSDVADDDDHQKHEHDRPMGDDLRRVDQHADRNEKDRGEDIADRLHQVLDRLLDARFGDEAAGEKGAECDRVAERRGQQRETERDAHAGDDGRFRPIEAERRRESAAAR